MPKNVALGLHFHKGRDDRIVAGGLQMRASSHFLWLEGYKLLDVASKCFTTSDVVGKQFR